MSWMGIKQLYNDNLRTLPNEYGDVSVMVSYNICFSKISRTFRKYVRRLTQKSLCLVPWSSERFSVSTLTPISSKDVDSDVVSCSCDESGVQEPTTLTPFNEHKRDFWGISMARADKLHTRAGILVVAPACFNSTTRGQTVKSPNREMSTCLVMAVWIWPTLISLGDKRIP